MGIRNRNRCWQCKQPLAINDTYCPRCGAWPKPGRAAGSRDGLVGWILDHAAWMIGILALVFAVPLTIKILSEPDQSRAGDDSRPSTSERPVAALPAFFDPLKAWPLERVPPASAPGTIVEIVSGDRFILEPRSKRRAVVLAGDDAPEIGGQGWPGACYPEESRTHLAEVLPPGTLLFVDSEATNANGSEELRGFIWFADRGASRAFLINELVVAHGDALADLPVGDAEIDRRLTIAENEASAGPVGLWAACAVSGATPDAAPSARPDR